MATKKVILALGGAVALETQANQEIDSAITAYNEQVQIARVALANRLYQLPTEVGAKMLTEVATYEHELPVFTIINSGRRATLADASSIMGPDFISHHMMADIFCNRVNVPKLSEVDMLPYTVAMLERMTEIGAVLLYQPYANNGETIDLNLFAQLQKGLIAKPDGVLLYRDQFTEKGTVSSGAWFADKKYDVYRSQQIVTSGVWRLATKAVLPTTLNETFVSQIAIVCDWMEQTLCKGLVMPSSWEKAITEFRAKHTTLQKLQDNDAQVFLKEVQTLSFWKCCMETGLETLLRMVAYNQSTSQKLLVDMYTRNSVIEPFYDELGVSGSWSGDGPDLCADHPGFRWGRRGLGFSCTDAL